MGAINSLHYDGPLNTPAGLNNQTQVQKNGADQHSLLFPAILSLQKDNIDLVHRKGESIWAKGGDKFEDFAK